MKNLNDILANIKILDRIGDTNITIENIKFDSRNVNSNSIFIAVRGVNVDGHNYINKAIKLKAKAIVCEEFPENIDKNTTYIKVKDSAIALGLLASNFYDNPSQKITVVGITGTNGKTTTATLLYNMFESLGYKTGLISTVINYVHNKEIKSTHTTPDQVQLQKLFAQMIDEGCEYCFMEVSSHAIHQQRIAGIEFDGGIFTNLTHDHLDYHKTFVNYRDAKKQFFDDLSEHAFALSNLDDKNGMFILQNTVAKKYYYALKTPADFNARILETDFHGTLLDMDGKEVWIKLIGEFNVYNILAIYGASVLLGLDEETALVEISKLTPVRGRMETIRSLDGKTFIIDYAHTPDALENILNVLNEMKVAGRDIITVFGAGGDRDKDKRPKMGKIAAMLSDKVIITSDNPRSEDAGAIMEDIRSGITNEKDAAKTLMIPDREVAIRTAILMSKPGDIIVIAGKGHEEYQEIGGIKHHFSDKEVVLKNIKVLK